MTKAEFAEFGGILQRINTTAQELEIVSQLQEAFGIRIDGLLDVVYALLSEKGEMPKQRRGV